MRYQRWHKAVLRIQDTVVVQNGPRLAAGGDVARTGGEELTEAERGLIGSKNAHGSSDLIVWTLARI